MKAMRPYYTWNSISMGADKNLGTFWSVDLYFWCLWTFLHFCCSLKFSVFTII